jgi:hypothetical protein
MAKSLARSGRLPRLYFGLDRAGHEAARRNAEDLGLIVQGLPPWLSLAPWQYTSQKPWDVPWSNPAIELIKRSKSIKHSHGGSR